MAEIESIRQTALHPKIRLLLEIFERHQGEQIIIFCRYVETITVIRAYLKKYGFRAVFLVGQSHPELQTKKQAARALTRITKGQDSACVSSVANEGLNIFQRAHVAVLYSPPQSSIQLVQVEGRMGRTSVGDKIYNLLFGEFDRRKYWANFVGMGKILQGVNIIPERFTLHDPNFATLNLPASKGAYWSQDLVYCHGQLIRERFLCERVHDLGDQRGKRCITFNLRDKTGIINAHLYLDKRIMAHDEIERRVKYCYSAFSQIVVISGKVEVTLDDNLDLFNPAERLVTVHMHADQRQNVLICPSKYVLRDDYQN